jgi:hypothetical protein
MGHRPNILDVVESLSLLISWNTSSRLTRIYSLENTKPPEILDGDLEHLEAFRPSNEGRL